MNTFTIPKNRPRDNAIAELIRFIHRLPETKAYKVELSEIRRTRSQQQNAYLWGVCYPSIIRGGGEAMRGWTSDDLHEYFLGEHFGWETLEGFGRKRLRPLRRSSKLSVVEFMEYVDFVQQKAAEFGIYIPSPGEELVAA